MQSPVRYEQILIGTALGFPLSAGDASDVRPQDMSTRSHQTLWTAIIELDRGARLSYPAVVEKMYALDAMNDLGADVEDGDITGEAYLEELLGKRAEGIREWSDGVIGSAIRRDMKTLGHLIALDAESEIEIDELLDAVEDKVYALRRTNIDTGIDTSQLLGLFETRMELVRTGRFVPAFQFVTPGLGRLIPFMDASDYMLIAGRPGEGKSSILRSEAFAAAQRGQKVAIINMENSEIEYANYLIASVVGIDTAKLRQPELLSEEEVTRVREAIAQLRALPLRIVSMGAPSVHEVIRVMRKLMAEGFEVFFVDYVQLIKNGIESDVSDISMTSTLLRGFSRKYNKPVIAAAQLNRGIVHRQAGAEPQLADLRGSGSLEQDAVIVVFTSLMELDEAALRRYPQNVDVDGQLLVVAAPVKLFVRKNRNGPTGITPPILWQKHINRYSAMVPDRAAPPARAPRQPRATQAAMDV